jgi:hypothetical protein
MLTRKTQVTWFVFVLVLMFARVPDSSAAPSGDGGGLLGLLDVAVQNQMDDLFATEDPTIANADPATNKFGPYPSVTTDSGTCGADWAEDTVNRYFSIQLIAPNTYSVIEKFKKGTFTTFAQLSPGACDNSDGTPPGAIAAGFTGTFHGYLVMTVSAATVYSPSTASCVAPCFSTNTFLASVFPAGFVRNDDAFFFHYVADNPGSLIYHEWKNASCNRGGNHGDIASASALATEIPFCP